eukprot:350436-Chlamydomonas_euryale.AAC.5
MQLGRGEFVHHPSFVARNDCPASKPLPNKFKLYSPALPGRWGCSMQSVVARARVPAMLNSPETGWVLSQATWCNM